jgi:hypothetical protein
MNKEEIFQEIDNEIIYGDNKWNNNQKPDNTKSISDWLTYIEFHHNKAKINLFHTNNDEALSEIRKITALGVKCLRMFGCPKRNL